MLVPVVRGQAEFVEKINGGEILEKACPECHNDLHLKYLRTWRTFFFIPIMPTNEKRFVYECAGCKITYDPVYREYFINRAKYKNFDQDELINLNNKFSLVILASILIANKTLIQEHQNLLSDFSNKQGVNSIEYKSNLEYILQEERALDEKVFHYYDVYRDCFVEDLRLRPLIPVIKYCKSLTLDDSQKKKLYIYSKHWGMTNDEFGSV